MLRLVALCATAGFAAVVLSYGVLNHYDGSVTMAVVMAVCFTMVAATKDSARAAVSAAIIAILATFAAFSVAANPIWFNYGGGAIVVLAPPLMVSPVAGLYLDLKWWLASIPLMVESVAIFTLIMQFAPSVH